MIWTVAIAKYQVRFYLYDKILNKNTAFYEDGSEVPTEFYKRRYEVVEVANPFETGDIVDFKVILWENEWTDEQRKEFKIITLIVPGLREMEEGLLEPLYDNKKAVLKKRRMSVPIDEVEEFAPYLFTICFDKLKNRRLELTDKLRKME